MIAPIQCARRFLVPAIVLLTCGAPLSHSAQRAVIVGINTYPDKPLRGCVNDAQTMKSILMTRYGFPESGITLLTDAKATKHNIEQAFNDALIKQSRPGDVAVFYFSGHGFFVPDESGDEPDQNDEMLMTPDFTLARKSTWLTDDHLRYWLSKLRTDRVLVILDTCHSGTGTRGGDDLHGKFYELGYSRGIGGPDTRSFRPGTTMKVRTNMNHVLLAACASHEIARERTDQPGALFSSYLLKELKSAEPGMKFSDLKDNVNPKVAEYVRRTRHPHKPQTPQYEGSLNRSITDFLGAKTGKPPRQDSAETTHVAPPEPQTEGNLKIDLAIDKHVYTEGDKMQVTLKAGQDCHVRLYYRDARGEISMIYPNRFEQNTRVRSNRTVSIPSPESDFDFVMGEPYGAEALLAVASPTPFTDENNDVWRDSQTFLAFKDSGLADVKHRGITIRARKKNDWGKAIVFYRVKAR